MTAFEASNCYQDCCIPIKPSLHRFTSPKYLSLKLVTTWLSLGTLQWTGCYMTEGEHNEVKSTTWQLTVMWTGSTGLLQFCCYQHPQTSVTDSYFSFTTCSCTCWWNHLSQLYRAQEFYLFFAAERTINYNAVNTVTLDRHSKTPSLNFCKDHFTLTQF